MKDQSRFFCCTLFICILGVIRLENILFELNNIQSHEATTFSLNKGLNFILAEDNNVGKSTIFRTIVTMSKMPRVSNDDLISLLRVGAMQGYVSMKFGNSHIVFWLVREGNRVRAFFENYIESESPVRTASCPDVLIKALDIVVGSDGLPINLTDADSVKLVVEDSTKNDEVLAKVLVDDIVERIKANSIVLARSIRNDYNLIAARYNDAATVLESLSYNSSVDSFMEEEDLLYSCVRVMDTLDARCGGLSEISIDEADIHILNVAYSLYERFINIDCDAITRVSKDIDKCLEAFAFLNTFSSIDIDCLQRDYKGIETAAMNMERAIVVLRSLSKTVYSTSTLVSLKRKLDGVVIDLEHTTKQLASNTVVVDCPMRGAVYFGEKCISVDN